MAKEKGPLVAHEGTITIMRVELDNIKGLILFEALDIALPKMPYRIVALPNWDEDLGDHWFCTLELAESLDAMGELIWRKVDANNIGKLLSTPIESEAG